MTPFGLAFEELEEPQSDNIFVFNNLWNSIESVIDIIFIIEVFVCFNTSYYDPLSNEYVYNRWLIAKTYLKGWFWVDIFAIIPRFVRHVSSIATILSFMKIARVSRLLKLLRLLKMAKTLK